MNSRSTAAQRRQRLLMMLAGRKGLTDMETVGQALGWSTERAEDELRDAVSEGAVEFNPRANAYRLAATPLCREAARRLVLRKLERAMLGTWSGDGRSYHVSLAMFKPLSEADGPGQQLLLAQIEIPSPVPRDYRLALKVADSFDSGLLMEAAQQAQQQQQQQPQPLAA
jgi:hypothetical protein